ncbi:uncharacterized protein N0V89_003481 [Didymosphaeria variabile]|uniref:lytic cellulose monooxygenase (C4-dehydrogenating) n=1 Tax=Didymosphaeria variabile TaxID=1932322 RepID=A0A9W9CCA4_9PLEO|nr:uncharacterized protein N0V89_003481 [Didymosphaeria variabile]KAJ4355465.1 hypothetical protein N0V89_003481 [Didymosphaeria variabile]
MKSLPATLAVVAALASTTCAHWTYDRIIVNDQVIGEPWQYVRHHSNGNNFLSDVTSTDMRCNIDGLLSGVNTSTYPVNAGDRLGFTIKDTFGHPGPQQVYISKAPADVKDYDGSGDWSKIYTLSDCRAKDCGTGDGVVKWATYRAQTFNFKLPAELPAGEYLLRAEGIAIHAAQKIKGAQFYVACAQIRVSSNGTGVPGPTIKFPGGYTANSTGILIPQIWSQITNYTSPGPKLWPEGTEEAHVLDGKVKQSD